MVSIKIGHGENTVEFSGKTINSTINALETVVKDRIGKIDSKIVSLNDKLKIDENGQPLAKPNILTTLSHEDIVKLSQESEFGHEVKHVKGQIIYQWGNLEELDKRELDLVVVIDHSEESQGHSIKLGGTNYLKNDFLELYSVFDKLCEKAVGKLMEAFKDSKIEIDDQISMFPEMENARMESIDVTMTIFNYFKQDSLPTTLTICCYSDGLYALKFDKKIFLHKGDLYFLYNKFDSIISKILGDNT